MALNGISALVMVTQMKSAAANAPAISPSVKQPATMAALHEALYASGDNFGNVKAASQGALGAIRSRLDDAMKELESQDRMGNFEIQRLMSAFNQAETLSSNVQKKLDDTHNAVISKF